MVSFLGREDIKKLSGVPLRSRKRTGMCGSMPGGGFQSAGAPGIPDPAAGTRTAFLSSVRLTHWSTRLCSRSISCSVLSAHKKQILEP